jgi:hypothetical protein
MTDLTTTTVRIPTVSLSDIIRNVRARLASLTCKRVLGFATQTDLKDIQELQNRLDQLQREETERRYQVNQ